MCCHTVSIEERLAVLVADNGGHLTVGEFFEVVSC